MNKVEQTFDVFAETITLLNETYDSLSEDDKAILKKINELKEKAKKEISNEKKTE